MADAENVNLADRFRADLGDIPGQASPQRSLAVMANIILGALPSIVQVLHAIPDDQLTRPARNVIARRLIERADQLVAVRAVAEEQEARAAHEHTVPIISRLPPEHPDNAVNDIPQARTYKLQDFGGTAEDKVDCLNWLARILRLGQQNHLTYPVIIGLLERHSTGSAAQMVSDAMRANQTLEEIVRALEVRYSGLQHPQSARIAVNAIVRIKDEDGKLESISVLADKIKKLSFMATRLTRLPAAQLIEENELAKANLMRCLVTNIHTELVDKIHVRRVTSGPEYTYTGLIAEIEDLERRARAYGHVGFRDEPSDETAEKAAKVAEATIQQSEVVKLMTEMSLKQTENMEEVVKMVKQFDTRTTGTRPKSDRSFDRNRDRSYDRYRDRSNERDRGRTPNRETNNE